MCLEQVKLSFSISCWLSFNWWYYLYFRLLLFFPHKLSGYRAFLQNGKIIPVMIKDDRYVTILLAKFTGPRLNSLRLIPHYIFHSSYLATWDTFFVSIFRFFALGSGNRQRHLGQPNSSDLVLDSHNPRKYGTERQTKTTTSKALLQ